MNSLWGDGRWKSFNSADVVARIRWQFPADCGRVWRFAALRCCFDQLLTRLTPHLRTRGATGVLATTADEGRGGEANKGAGEGAQ